MIARLEDFNARRLGVGPSAPPESSHAADESADAAANNDDRRSAHLRGRLTDDVRENGCEHGIVIERRGAHQVEADLLGDASGFEVDIEEHFEVIGDKSNGTRHDVSESALAFFTQGDQNVGSEPRIGGATGRLPRDVEGRHGRNLGRERRALQ